MARRWGPGPVFYFECLTNARRWQLFALRTLAAALPGIVLFLVCWAKLGGRPVTVSNLASTGESFFFALVGTQLALILLAAPAYTAGAICLDKERGTLLHMLATDLSDTEIILGKLGVRLLAVLGLVVAVVPVLFGAILLGGIDPAAALGALLVSLGVALWTSTLALTLSVWMRKTYEVLLVVYMILVFFLLFMPMWGAIVRKFQLPPFPDAMKMTNPFWLAYLPYLRPGASYLSDQVIFLAVSLGMSAILCTVAVLRVRAVALSQTGRLLGRKRRLSLWRWIPGPSLDFNPVLWREWHRKTASRWSLFAWLVYAALASLLSQMAIRRNLDGLSSRDLAVWVNSLQVSVGLLLLSIGSVTSLAEERARGNLDVLLTTTLSTRQILLGKWWGAYRPVFLLTVLPGVVAISTCTYSANKLGVPLLIGLILAYGAALTSLCMAVAIWISRPSHAQVISVIVFILITIGPFLPQILFDRSDVLFYLGLVSPFIGVGVLTSDLSYTLHSSRSDKILIWSCFWLTFYLGVALLLFVLSLATFDSCLGRVRRMQPPGFPPHDP